jgi:hypothetical protein
MSMGCLVYTYKIIIVRLESVIPGGCTVPIERQAGREAHAVFPPT